MNTESGSGGEDPGCEGLVRRLQASEQKFKAILDTATDAVLSIDAGHRIILYNRAACEMFGYDAGEVLGKDLRTLIPQQYGDHYQYVRRFLETRVPRVMGKPISLTAIRKNGEEFPIEIGLSHTKMEGEETFTAIIRDLSHQRHLEKKLLQSERLAAVGQAVAYVVHEIRNPLMIIGAFSEQIKRMSKDPKTVQKLEMVLDEVARLERFVSELRDLTKVYELMKRPSDIDGVIKDVVGILREFYPPEKFSFEISSKGSPKEIYCDPDKLKQVLMNVVENGLEAMEEGGVLGIESRHRGEGVEILISDQGCGIHPENLPRIFDPFFTTRQKGSGLGLSICYKIVEAHKGEISANSRPGGGTVFFIRIPAT